MNNHHWIIESIYSNLNKPVYYYYCEKCAEEAHGYIPLDNGCPCNDIDYKQKHIQQKLDHYHKRINYYRLKISTLNKS